MSPMWCRSHRAHLYLRLIFFDVKFHMNSWPRSKTYFLSKVFLKDQFLGNLDHDLNWKYTHRFGPIPDGLEHKRYAFDQAPAFVLDRIPKISIPKVKTYIDTMGVDPEDYVALFLAFGRTSKNSPWTIQVVRQWRG